MARVSGFAHDFLSLLFGANKKYVFARGNDLLDLGVGLFEELMSLLQINNGDTITIVVNVRFRLWIPAAELMTEVNACVE